MRAVPRELFGYCFVIPDDRAGCLDEIDRCVADRGMIGVKLYHQCLMNHPLQFPIIERCIDLGVPILMHAAHMTDPASCSRRPRLSGGEHFADAARRYPEAMLICAHIGGGGDWEWQIKTSQRRAFGLSRHERIGD